MTERALLFAIAVIAGVLVLLSVVIVLNKAIREARASHRRRWRRALEPGLQKYLAAQEGPLPEFANVPQRGAGREAAVDFLLDHSEVVRGEARDRISRALEGLGFVDQETARLGSRSWWHRASAADRLGLSRSPRAIEALTQHLEDADGDVRLRAAKALGMIGGQAAIRPLVAALAQPSRWSTLRVAEILASMGGGVESELVATWHTMPRVSRLATLDILGRLRIPGSAAFLLERLSDEDPDLRARAAHALGKLGDPTVHRGLIGCLRDPEWPVRAMAAKALGRIRAAEGVEPLTALLQDRQWWARSNAAEALRDLGARGAAALLKALDAPDPFARHQAVLMLEQSGVIDQYAADLPLGGAPAENARAVLKRIADLGQTARLEDLARSHPDAATRTSLAGLLAARGILTGPPGPPPARA